MSDPEYDPQYEKEYQMVETLEQQFKAMTERAEENERKLREVGVAYGVLLIEQHDRQQEIARLNAVVQRYECGVTNMKAGTKETP